MPWDLFPSLRVLLLAPKCSLGYLEIMNPEKSPRNDGSSETGHLSFSDVGGFLVEAERRTQANEDVPEGPPSYRLALGREVIHLSIVEFRILLFLAGRPYVPFTRRRIADAVSTARHPVTEDTVDQHIASLRDQLGFFHDLVQSVPYVGYRFKA